MSDTNEEAQVSSELKKLGSIAVDMDINSKMRGQAIDRLGEISNHEALLVLLNIAANDKLGIDERDLALKRARDIVRKGR